MLITVSSFDEAKLYCEYFEKLNLPLKYRKMLNSGKVLFAFKRGFSSFNCMTRFPLDLDPTLGNLVRTKELVIPEKAQVVMTVGLTKGSPNILKSTLRDYLTYNFALAILALKNPNKPNFEDKEVKEFVKKEGITVN